MFKIKTLNAIYFMNISHSFLMMQINVNYRLDFWRQPLDNNR